MTILAIDSSATAASAALTRDGKVLGEFYCNVGLTHSQTLMPMVRDLLKNTRVGLEKVDLFAVSAGPGSFTGIRIGVASIKGLAFPSGKPCVGVSTLEAIAQNLSHLDCTVCAVMDARCGQVYNAVFRSEGGRLERLTADRAISAEDLAKECKEYAKPLFLVGDGAKLCYNRQGFQTIGAQIPPEPLLYQHAVGVAKTASLGKAVSPAALMPVYLRPAQAERALSKKLEGSKNDCTGSRPRRLSPERSN
ncbi:MAG: tRNA (adenosine(37)-N6)-threonylcarbamoyltransferase complex dimerization subunit type 1 TsaB [Oscillospiraceae bacterium]|jgi:tRNA threonylcarbamoyladenosine biosynthesis protein TsaB|nr:tRNA (adenosine(37)-N6)-threonylcarbamoyltransferase complex dimerization subunit type 1 TsaB [Oscillospiraceae bacterium]